VNTPSPLVRMLVHGGLFLFTLAVLYPVAWVVSMAVSPSQTFASGVLPLPTGVDSANMMHVTSGLFGRQLLNSVFVAVGTAVMGLGLSTTAAYALSRFRFPGREQGLGLFLATQMFPQVVLAIPLYLLLDELHLLDSLMGLVLVYSATSVPFSTFTLKGWFDSLPKDLEEAALLDGASRWQTFVWILLPLARPALAVTFLFSFMQAWNEFALANTLLSDPRSFTLPIVLQHYVSDYGTEWGHFAAGAVLVSLPVMALFFALQKQFVEGLTAGAVKG
jgi:arabinogalactan oligomer/maltooligosaccharide transport system permease protein